MLEQAPAAGEVVGGGVPFCKEDGYSVVLPEKLSDGKWNVYRSAKSPLKLVDLFPQSHIRTMHDNFEYAVATFGEEPFLGTRTRPDGSVGKYQWVTYAEAAESRAAVGAALVYYGVKPGARVGLYMQNRAEWVITEQACYAYGLVSVPLYDTLGPEAVEYILGHAEISAVLCTPDKLPTILDCIRDKAGSPVSLIVVVGGSPTNPPTLPAAPEGVTLLPFFKLEAQGRASPSPFTPSPPESMCSICYTSGTTGVPKGAMLSHRGMVATVAGSLMGAEIMAGDVYLSYLPLAHIYERMNMQILVHVGAAVGFYQGDVLKLMDDLEELKPTVFASVPRLYNRIYDRILATVKASGGIREYIFNVAYNSKKSALEKGRASSAVWERLVFNKIKARLGGRVRLMITGASPIAPEVIEFLRVCFGARVCEGYGMTETTCTISLVDATDLTTGHVGSPNPACEVKLVDVPEMDYLSTDKPFPRGEICVRGPTVIQGYYKDPKQTAELIDPEGWLHTGDIGCWLPKGRLKIIDRKKNIFKLAQGEYVAPEKIENVYLQSPLVAQCFVHGDSLNSELVAVVVPDPEALQTWLKSHQRSKGAQATPSAPAAGAAASGSQDVARLCKDPAVKAAILADMDLVAQKAKLRGFECVKNIYLTPEPFTLENGLLTPTFKVKRPQAKAYFQKEIEGMYAELASGSKQQSKDEVSLKSLGADKGQLQSRL